MVLGFQSAQNCIYHISYCWQNGTRLPNGKDTSVYILYPKYAFCIEHLIHLSLLDLSCLVSKLAATAMMLKVVNLSWIYQLVPATFFKGVIETKIWLYVSMATIRWNLQKHWVSYKIKRIKWLIDYLVFISSICNISVRYSC